MPAIERHRVNTNARDPKPDLVVIPLCLGVQIVTDAAGDECRRDSSQCILIELGWYVTSNGDNRSRHGQPAGDAKRHRYPLRETREGDHIGYPVVPLHLFQYGIDVSQVVGDRHLAILRSHPTGHDTPIAPAASVEAMQSLNRDHEPGLHVWNTAQPFELRFCIFGVPVETDQHRGWLDTGGLDEITAVGGYRWGTNVDHGRDNCTLRSTRTGVGSRLQRQNAPAV